MVPGPGTTAHMLRPSSMCIPFCMAIGPAVPRASASARTAGGAFTVLVHVLLIWALMRPLDEVPDEPPALPPLRVQLLGAPSIFAAPAPLEAVPVLPELSVLLPALIVRTPAQIETPMVPTPSASFPAESTSAAASPEMTGAGPQLRRSDGRAPDCQLPGWLNLVSQAIGFSLRYPAQARQLGEIGTAYVRLNVSRTGRVLEFPLLRSSGHRSLDDEARDVVRRIGRFAPVPATDCVGYDVIVVDQPIRFGS